MPQTKSLELLEILKEEGAMFSHELNERLNISYYGVNLFYRTIIRNHNKNPKECPYVARLILNRREGCVLYYLPERINDAYQKLIKDFPEYKTDYKMLQSLIGVHLTSSTAEKKLTERGVKIAKHI